MFLIFLVHLEHYKKPISPRHTSESKSLLAKEHESQTSNLKPVGSLNRILSKSQGNESKNHSEAKKCDCGSNTDRSVENKKGQLNSSEIKCGKTECVNEKKKSGHDEDDNALVGLLVDVNEFVRTP